MSRISNIGQFLPRISPVEVSPPPPSSTLSDTPAPTPDTVELSALARSFSSQILNGTSLSDTKAAAIRSEIAGGTFETPERLQGTVERLLDVIG